MGSQQQVESNWLGCAGEIIEAVQPLDVSYDDIGYPIWDWLCDYSPINGGDHELAAAALPTSYPSIDSSFLPEFFLPSHDLFQDDLSDMFLGEMDQFGHVDDQSEKKDGDHDHDNESCTTNGHGEKREEERKEMTFIKKVERCREDQRVITFEEVSRYFYMPITQAAKELNIGLTLLKKKCRELGIPRWPHRKMKSLQTLINNVQELVREDGPEGEGQLRRAMEILEKEKKLMEKDPGMQLEQKTKRLRQACFKANYKRRRLLGLPPILHTSQSSNATTTTATPPNCCSLALQDHDSHDLKFSYSSRIEEMEETTSIL